MSKGAKIGIFFLVVVILIMGAVDLWWLGIYVYGPDKVVLNTFEFDTIETLDGSESDYVIRIKYFSNENNNGLEALEINFSSFLDESQNKIYQQGIQVVIKEGKELGLKYIQDSRQKIDTIYNGIWWNPLSWLSWTDRYNAFGHYELQNCDVSYYQSSDNYQTTLGNQSYFADDGFIITLENEQGGNDTYLLRFRGSGIFDHNLHSDDGYLVWPLLVRISEQNNYYFSYDINYFVSYVLETFNSVQSGSQGSTIVKFGEMFDYYVYEEGKSYTQMKTLENSKVDVINRTFAGVYFEKSADGLQKATDSMFGQVNDSPSYNNTSDETLIDDYLFGKNVVNLTENDFDYVLVSGTTYHLKLSDSFIESFSSKKDKIILSVSINLDTFRQNETTFAGFTADNGLSDFDVYECYSYSYSTGSLVKSEVNYE